MSLGLLDIPGLLLGPIDSAPAAIKVPALLRLLGWGWLSGYAGMWIYRRFSPQQRIAEVRTMLADVQKQLASYDGEFSGLLPLIRKQFSLAMRQLRLTTAAALLAALPILLMLPWISNTFSERNPAPGESLMLCAEPAQAATQWQWNGRALATDAEGCQQVDWPEITQPLQLKEGSITLLQLPLPAPAGIVHKRHWLNVLVGNPAGYLPEQARTSSIRLHLPYREFIPIGPSWMRGWEAVYFLSALVVSLWLRWRWKLN